MTSGESSTGDLGWLSPDDRADGEKVKNYACRVVVRTAHSTEPWDDARGAFVVQLLEPGSRLLASLMAAKTREDFLRLVFVVLKRRRVDVHRIGKRVKPMGDGAFLVEDEQPTPAQHVMDVEVEEDLEELGRSRHHLAALRPDLRELVEMRLDGMTHRQICRRLGLPVGKTNENTIGRKILRAIAALRRKLLVATP